MFIFSDPLAQHQSQGSIRSTSRHAPVDVSAAESYGHP
ncbi:hypothetical protein BN2537_13709 [Streptomyces venezuelae]|nr:hypothetical protein BN2537_13709 [Streptomyces venezuelae]